MAPLRIQKTHAWIFVLFVVISYVLVVQRLLLPVVDIRRRPPSPPQSKESPKDLPVISTGIPPNVKQMILLLQRHHQPLPPLPKDAPCATLECIQHRAERLAQPFRDRSNDTAWRQGPFHSLTKRDSFTTRSANNSATSLHGILLAKVPKGASSTAAGVALRIARHYGHVPVYGLHHEYPILHGYARRDATKTILLGTIRDPSTRAMSYLSYTCSRQRKQMPTDIADWMHLNYDRSGGVTIQSWGRGGIQLAFLTLQTLPKYSVWSYSNPRLVTNAAWVEDHIRGILKDYDFLLVVERMEESLVVLALLLGISIEDVLVLSSKRGGSSYLPVTTDNGTECIFLPSPPYSPLLQEYFTNNASWHAMNYGDYLLHRAANISLDRTIDVVIGRTRFEQAFETYQYFKRLADDQCTEVEQPCSSRGIYQPNVASQFCYQSDYGCGYPCIDHLLLQQQQRRRSGS